MHTLHTKRILRCRGLGRRANRTDPRQVCEAIEEELRGSGSTIGYRQMTQRLVVDHGLVVGKETVRELMKILKKSVRPTCNFFVL